MVERIGAAGDRAESAAGARSAQVSGWRADTDIMFGDASTISADLDAMTEVTALLEARALTSAFQPVVRLATGETTGYEALARGPVGTRWESPVELFCAATAIGRVPELDWTCRTVAMEAAVLAGMHPATTLFVNTEPTTLAAACPEDLRQRQARMTGRLRIVTELTERALSTQPAAVLAAAAASRRAGYGVALDNVGGDPAALALLPLVRPDVVKLDGYLLRRPTHADTRRVAVAVAAYAEETGACVVATGIETEEQLRVARAIGATFGQGWLLGRPARLPVGRRAIGGARVAAGQQGGYVAGFSRVRREPMPLLVDESPAVPASAGGRRRGRGPVTAGPVTPYDIVAAGRAALRVPAEMVLAVARRAEGRATTDADPPALLVCLPTPGGLGRGVPQRYSTLAGGAAFLGVFGVGLDRLTGVGVPDVTLVPLDRDDPLCREWNVLVLGPQSAVAITAREPAGGLVAGAPRYDFAMTSDRALVVTAARCLLSRYTDR